MTLKKSLCLSPSLTKCTTKTTRSAWLSLCLSDRVPGRYRTMRSTFLRNEVKSKMPNENEGQVFFDRATTECLCLAKIYLDGFEMWSLNQSFRIWEIPDNDFVFQEMWPNHIFGVTFWKIPIISADKPVKQYFSVSIIYQVHWPAMLENEYRPLKNRGFGWEDVVTDHF